MQFTEKRSCIEIWEVDPGKFENSSHVDLMELSNKANSGKQGSIHFEK